MKLVRDIAEFCPKCGKMVGNNHNHHCDNCGSQWITPPIENIVIVAINSLRAKELKHILICFFILFLVAAKIGGIIASSNVNIAIFSLLLAFTVFLLIKFWKRIGLFLWKLRNDYRTIKINTNVYNVCNDALTLKRYIMSLTPREFEEYVADMFRNIGFEANITPATSDGGKDIILRKDGVTYYVECKQWKKDSSISRPVLQKLIGSAITDGITNVIFVSTCKYAQTVVEAARNNKVVNVNLWDIEDLVKAVEHGKFVRPYY